MAAWEAEGVRWEEALEVLRSTEAPRYLSASQELSRLSRVALAGLYASLRPYCPPTSAPLDRLLTDEAFDAEQIWQQIELLARPLLSSLRRHLTRLSTDAPPLCIRTEGKEGPAASGAPLLEEMMGAVPHVDEEKEGGGEDSGEAEEEEEEEEDEDEDEGGGVEGNAGVVEDRFLKIKELEEYLQRDEAKEYGLSLAQHRNSNKKMPAMDKEEEEDDDDGEDEGEEEDDDDGDEDEQDGGFDFGDVDHDSNEDADPAENAMYEDFFRSKKQKRNKQQAPHKRTKGSSERTSLDGSEYLEMDEEQRDDEDADMQDNEFLSTHEKELQKLQSKIKQMEKANMEPKSWTMQGEVTAAKRPKNSALEVDLDFKHNVRPPPVITEEITASLEDLIKKRIIEGRFDDVQRATALPSKAPKPRKELDENKSQKGLAEIYEEEYAQRTGLVSAPLSASDEKKEEASTLFKKLCLKLDALSHFHFAPKPVIEDMSIQSNVPALAMEEIAPLAVSDAAMLAPEEIFEGKGDIKEEAELTQAERKRRRANKKRKFKAETAKKAAKKARANASLKRLNGQEES